MKKHESNIIIISTILSAISTFYQYSELKKSSSIFFNFFTSILAYMFMIYIVYYLPYLFFKKKSQKANFPELFGWKRIVYFFSGIIGFYNPIFWLILAVGHMSTNFGDKFWHKNTHKLIYYLGFIKLIIIGTGLILLFFYLF